MKWYQEALQNWLILSVIMAYINMFGYIGGILTLVIFFVITASAAYFNRN